MSDLPDQQYKDRFIARLTIHHGFSQEVAVEEYHATIEDDSFFASTAELDADEAASYYVD